MRNNRRPSIRSRNSPPPPSTSRFRPSRRTNWGAFGARAHFSYLSIRPLPDCSQFRHLLEQVRDSICNVQLRLTPALQSEQLQFHEMHQRLKQQISSKDAKQERFSSLDGKWFFFLRREHLRTRPICSAPFESQHVGAVRKKANRIVVSNAHNLLSLVISALFLLLKRFNFCSTASEPKQCSKFIDRNRALGF